MVQAVGKLSGTPTRGFVWLRSGDIEQLQRTVLMDIADMDGDASCIFGDINDHVSKRVRGLLDAAMPDDEDEADALHYAVMQEALMDNLELAFPRKGTAWCYRHLRQCPVDLTGGFRHAAAHAEEHRPQVFHGVSKRVKYSSASKPPCWEQAYDDMGEEFKSDTVAPDVQEAAFLKAALSAVCPSDGVHESSTNTTRPYICTWGSTVCTGWCPIGSRKQAADPSSRAHHIFVAERRARCETKSEDSMSALLSDVCKSKFKPSNVKNMLMTYFSQASNFLCFQGVWGVVWNQF
jgi:hypothetical protein